MGSLTNGYVLEILVIRFAVFNRFQDRSISLPLPSTVLYKVHILEALSVLGIRFLKGGDNSLALIYII